MFYGTAHFQHLLSIERKRTERSKKPFLLMLLDVSELKVLEDQKAKQDKIKPALTSSLRDVDIRGWYDQGNVIGVIFTEIVSTDVPSIEKIVGKVYGRLCKRLKAEWVDKLHITYHVCPEVSGSSLSKGTFNTSLYNDLMKRTLERQVSITAKSIVDVSLSIRLLVVCLLLFLMS